MVKGISKQQSNDIIIKKTRKQRFDVNKPTSALCNVTGGVYPNNPF